jgi:tRNA pseudouridine55 synthase
MLPDGGELSGLLLVDKPRGPTSRQVVTRIADLLGARKAGHGGTLDPLATGLLVIMLGKATRLNPYLSSDPKVYEGSFILGMRTDTLDTEGTVLERRGFRGEREEVEKVFSSLEGESIQLPPAYSAAKYRGKPLYFYARKGREVPRRPRVVRVYSAEVKGWRAGNGMVEVEFFLSCSPGTYVRELVERVGNKLGCGAVLSGLRRISSGRFHVSDALGLEELEGLVRRGESPPVLSPGEALSHLPRVRAKKEWVKRVENGGPLEDRMVEDLPGTVQEGRLVAVFSPCHELMGVYRVERGKPFLAVPCRIMA